jgi:hypothetical protein
MKRVLVEAISILILSLLITLLFNAASPSGIIMLKKAFRIKADAGNINNEHIIKASYSVIPACPRTGGLDRPSEETGQAGLTIAAKSALFLWSH